MNKTRKIIKKAIVEFVNEHYGEEEDDACYNLDALTDAVMAALKSADKKQQEPEKAEFLDVNQETGVVKMVTEKGTIIAEFYSNDEYAGVNVDAKVNEDLYYLYNAELPTIVEEGAYPLTSRLYAGNADTEIDNPVALMQHLPREDRDDSKRVIFVDNDSATAVSDRLYSPENGVQTIDDLSKRNAESPKQRAMKRAKDLITAFCEREYECKPDLTDLEKVGLAYTTVNDHELQVYVDLVNYRYYATVDGNEVLSEQYPNIFTMCDMLGTISFDGMIEEVEEKN